MLAEHQNCSFHVCSTSTDTHWIMVQAPLRKHLGWCRHHEDSTGWLGDTHRHRCSAYWQRLFERQSSDSWENQSPAYKVKQCDQVLDEPRNPKTLRAEQQCFIEHLLPNRKWVQEPGCVFRDQETQLHDLSDCSMIEVWWVALLDSQPCPWNCSVYMFNYSTSVQNTPWMLSKAIRLDPGVRNGLLKRKKRGQRRVPEWSWMIS